MVGFVCAAFFPYCFLSFGCLTSLAHSSCSLPHDLDTPFSRLLKHLLSACVSLDLCLFSFSNTELSRAVLLLHSRGVRVRVLTDRDYMAITGSQIGVLRKAGTDNTAILQIFIFGVVSSMIMQTAHLNHTTLVSDL